MKQTQFRILFRQFLFRMVDVELLSADARGNMTKLFGQFASLLVFIGIGLTWYGFVALSRNTQPGGLVVVNRIAVEWSAIHFVISTTMLVVGLFAVLSWDSTFPDRRDVMVLSPLPIRARTIFLARIATVATALSVTVATMHVFAGLFWPLLLNTRHEATVAPSIAWDAAIPPVSAAQLESVLKRDLPHGVDGGVVVGVWKRGEQRVFTYGTARPDSLFEIGSITKTFTALVLAQMAGQGRTRLDEPVRLLLPPDAVPQPAGQEITLLDLATHRSGLPSFPNRNPLARYSAADLYAYLNHRTLAKPPDAGFSYSNLGYGLLGHALENRAGLSYADLVRGITDALGLRDTVIQPSPAQKSRVIQGYDGLHRPAGLMDLGVLQGAGAIVSTAPDMLRYLTANLHPETAPDSLRDAMKAQQKLRVPISSGASIALAWIYDDAHGIYEHGGGTAGYTSSAFFSPKGDYAVIVLTNIGPDLFQFASVFGEHIRERLAGERAISLNAARVPAGGGGFVDFLRLLAVWWIVMMSAGAFVYCSVLGAQGIAAQLLPRRYFLRVSSLMQMAAFGMFVIAYFLEPQLVTPGSLMLAGSSTYLEWSPSYWFLGLFQQLSGSPALPELATRAWIGIGVAFGATAIAYTLAYFRTMRRIAEEPDIAPSLGGLSPLPRFGDGFATATVHFSIRTLLRSRQHRLLLAFYAGIGFAAAILFQKADEASHAPVGSVRLGLLCTTISLMILSVVGMRIVFALPTDMRANWIFRIAPYPSGPGCLTARRRASYVVSVAPVCLVTAAVVFSVWPWQAAAKHVLALALLGSVCAELALYGTRKLPFACSYLPGKSSFNITLLLSVNLGFVAIVKAAQWERDSFDNPAAYAALVGLLAALALMARWWVSRSSRGDLRFEEAEDPALFALDLHRDGVTQFDTAP
jgi:CubicO group peptidase (beta-lactamase class C family)